MRSASANMKCCLAITLRLLLFFSGHDFSAASSQVIVQPNDNATLACNFSKSPSVPDVISWLHYHEDELKLVLTIEYSRPLNGYMRIHNESNMRTYLDDKVNPWNLVIPGVKKSDLGVYHCLVRRQDKTLIAEASIRLSFTGTSAEGERGSMLCWALLVCVGITSACLGALVTFCIKRCQAKQSTKMTGNNDLRSVDLHYASLKYQGMNGQKHLQNHPPNVTYATAAHHCPTTISGLTC